MMRRGTLLSLSPRGFHRLAYWDWGRANDAPAVVCVHGLTRNGRDFDALAAALVDAGRRGACPDVVGRGESAWLADPDGYGYPQYMGDAVALLAALGGEAVDWVGTSMGGLLGMMLAAQPGSPIRKLVINDVGPFIPVAALRRIGAYMAVRQHWPDLAAAERDLRVSYASFGDLSDAQWRRFTEDSVRPAADGGFERNFDPAIAKPFEGAELADVNLWPLWDAISCPVLVLRGAQSDLLLPETAAEMAARGPRAEVVEVPDCGHAPALLDPWQIALVRDWLGRDDAAA